MVKANLKKKIKNEALKQLAFKAFVQLTYHEIIQRQLKLITGLNIEPYKELISCKSLLAVFATEITHYASIN